MPGVIAIQTQTALYFDNGFVVTFESPMFKKDIRTGDYFSDELIGEILTGSAISLAQSIEERTALTIYKEIKAAKANAGKPHYWKRPPKDHPFSDN